VLVGFSSSTACKQRALRGSLAFWATAFDYGTAAVIDKHGQPAWDRAYGFAFRVAAGIPTMADRARLDVGEEPGFSAMS
jgi:hypothetical protein